MQKGVFISSTHIDSEGEAMSLGALHNMVQQSQERKIWTTIEHDLVCPPLGYVGNARVVKLDDHHHGLYADFLYLAEDDVIDKDILINSSEQVEYEEVTFPLEDKVLMFNHNRLSADSAALLSQGSDKSRLVEKSATGDVNLILYVGAAMAFVAGTVGQEAVKGYLKGLGIDVEDAANLFGKKTRDSLSHILTPLGERIQEALIKSDLDGRRVRVGCEFNVGSSKVTCVIPFDDRKFDRSTFLQAASLLPSVVESLQRSDIDLMEADKIVFLYEEQSSTWKFIYATQTDGKLLISNKGRIYQNMAAMDFAEVARKRGAVSQE